jgi:hypothetical protein
MRYFRLSSYLKGELPSAPLDITAVSTITSLYVTWLRAGSACEHLSICLRCGITDRGVALFGHACALVRLTDVLLGVVRQQPSRAPLVAQLRKDLLSTIASWLEDARRELPIAARHLRTISSGSSDEISAALRQLDEVLSSASAGALPPGAIRRGLAD